MKIKFVDSVAGERFAYRTGEVVDLQDSVARQFLKEGTAVPHREEQRETATVGAVEKAVRGARQAARRLVS